jgi:RNA polymerase sigma-70 factor (ECF subfamily)
MVRKCNGTVNQPRRNEEFARLFAAGHRRIFGYVRSLVPLRDDADEVFQETCVVLWREFEKFRAGADFVPWALAIAYNQVRTYRHKARSDRLRFSEALIRQLSRDERAMARELQERRDALATCLERLRADDRDVIDRYYQDRTTVARVASQTGRPANTIYKALQRIRRRLLQCTERTLAAGNR